MSAPLAASAALSARRDAELVELAGPARRPIPGRDREPGPGQVGGHRGAHRAQPEEGDAVHTARW